MSRYLLTIVESDVRVTSTATWRRKLRNSAYLAPRRPGWCRYAVLSGPPANLLAHDDRCNAPAGGGCTCAEWERFDEERNRRPCGWCDSEGCAGFDNCTDEDAP